MRGRVLRRPSRAVAVLAAGIALVMLPAAVAAQATASSSTDLQLRDTRQRLRTLEGKLARERRATAKRLEAGAALDQDIRLVEELGVARFRVDEVRILRRTRNCLDL